MSPSTITRKVINFFLATSTGAIAAPTPRGNITTNRTGSRSVRADPLRKRKRRLTAAARKRNR